MSRKQRTTHATIAVVAANLGISQAELRQQLYKSIFPSKDLREAYPATQRPRRDSRDR